MNSTWIANLHRIGQSQHECHRRTRRFCRRSEGFGLAGRGAGAVAAACCRYRRCRLGGRVDRRRESAAKPRRYRLAGGSDRPAGGRDPAHGNRRHSSSIVRHAERRCRSGGAGAGGAGSEIRSGRDRKRDLGRHRDCDPFRGGGARTANTLSRHLADLSGRSARGCGYRVARHGIERSAHRACFITCGDADGGRRRPHSRHADRAMVSLRQRGRGRCCRGRSGARGLPRRYGDSGQDPAHRHSRHRVRPCAPD